MNTSMSLLTENILLKYRRFSHDKVRQSAYQLTTEEEKNKIHFRVGKALIVDSPTNNILIAANHLQSV